MDEDDLIGNDNEHDKDDEQSESSGDNGIDMEQDFGGQMEDIREN